MKKVLDFIVPAALLVLSAGCMGDLQYEEPIEGPVTRRYELSFDVPTKTALGQDNKHVSFVQNDKIFYYTKQAQLNSAGVTLENGVGYINLTLSGRNDYFLNAFYSGASNTAVTDPVYNITSGQGASQYSFCVENVAPAHQSFRSFAEVHACVAHLADLTQECISFRNIVSIFKFTLDDASVKKVVFSSPNSGAVINGGPYGLLQVTMNADGTLSSVTSDPGYNDGTNSITINTTAGEGDYYFAILPSYFPNGFVLSSYDSTSGNAQPTRVIEYNNPIVAGINADGDFHPSIINLGLHSAWKNKELIYPVRNLTVTPASLNFITGDDSQTLTATVTGDDQAVKTVSWNLADGGSDVVNVEKLSASGNVTTLKVTPVAAGSTTITFTTDGKDADGNHITKTVSISVREPDPDLGVDLSAKETANCYIVNQNSGKYRFNATVQGNSGDLVGEAKDAIVLWETRGKTPTVTSISSGTVVSGVKLSDDKNYVLFEAKGYGSALIAVRDANNTVLWSWHIWVWENEYDDATCFHTYKRSAGFMMDRDLGADANYPKTDAAQDKSAYGLLYQWGRKDPFFGSDKRVDTGNIPYPLASDAMVGEVRVGTIEYATAHPDVYILYGTSETHRDWIYGAARDNTLWGTNKTKYDPCPPGWKVPSHTVWSTALGSSINNTYYSAEIERQGLNFAGVLADDSPVFYQASGSMGGTIQTSYYSSLGDIGGATQYGDWWACGVNGNNGRMFSINKGARQANPGANKPRVNACNVRCIWDDVTSPQGQLPVTVPVTSVTLDITTKYLENIGDEFTLNATVLPDDASNKAINWTLEPANSNVVEVTSSGKVTARFSGTVTVVASSVADPTKFAKCVVTVGNPAAGGVVDLSANGTANSYIVALPGKYSFNCTVKGNSSQAISPAGANWLWMSDGTATAPDNLISNVQLEGNNITFEVPVDMKNGNVVIAALSSNGTVLWSWHIWLCAGFVPEQVAHTYYNGSTVMDRNLGATSATAGDIHAVGLMYQWGRKDPFRGVINPGNQVDDFAASRVSGLMNWDTPENTGLNDPLSYSINYPMHFILSKTKGDWMKSRNDNLWSGFTKSMYDPCPPGWMVPTGGEKGMWAQAYNAGPKPTTVGYNTNSTFGGTYTNVFQAGTIWFPFAGFIWPHTGTLGETGGNDLRVWTGTVYGTTGAYTLSQKESGFSFTSQSGRSYGASVRCVSTVPVTGVTISKTSLSLVKGGDGETLTAAVVPAHANNYGITWSSSNASIASVNSSGYVAGLKAGTCVITAKTNDGNFTATCNVTVK